MNRSEWINDINKLKALSEGRGILAIKILQQDPVMLKLFIIWPKMPIMWQPTEPMGEKESDDSFRMGAEPYLDRKIWAQAHPGYLKEVRNALELDSLRDARDAVMKARTLSLIWPDGSVNQRVLAFLISQTGGDLLEEIRDVVAKEKGKG